MNASERTRYEFAISLKVIDIGLKPIIFYKNSVLVISDMKLGDHVNRYRISLIFGE